MNILHTTRLNPAQASQISGLAGLCCQHDQIHLSFPTEEGCQYFLLYDNQNLLSALSLFFPTDELCECGAFTAPCFRRKGLFGQLFDAALEELSAHEERMGCDTELVFPVDERCADTMAVLAALDAQFWYAEYMMARPLSQKDAESPEPDASCLEIRESGGRCAFWHKGREAASCCLAVNVSSAGDSAPACTSGSAPASAPGRDPGSAPASASGRDPGSAPASAPGRVPGSAPPFSTAYLYDFSVTPGLRRQGIGTACLQALFTAAQKAGICSITLQVSGQNQAALALYRKTGFQITETLSYYLY